MHPRVHGNQAQSLAELHVPAGHKTDMHRHLAAEELYYVLSGRGRMHVGDEVIQVVGGDVIAVPAGMPHCVECIGPVKMRLLLCSTPPHSAADTECLEQPETEEPVEGFDEDVDTYDDTEDDIEPDPAAPSLFIDSGPQAVALRKSMKQNQRKFWQPVGITQSGASRYETGRNIPLSVRYVLHIAYAPNHQADELLQYLRTVLDSARLKPALLPVFGRADGEKVLEVRKRLGINQSKFWAAVGVTQSGGSRYEHGRMMPPPVARLLNIVYAHATQIEKRLERLRGGQTSISKKASTGAIPSIAPPGRK